MMTKVPTTILAYLEGANLSDVSTWLNGVFSDLAKEEWVGTMKGYKKDDLGVMLDHWPERRWSISITIEGRLDGTPFAGLSVTEAGELLQNLFGGVVYIDDLGQYCDPQSDYLLRITSSTVDLVEIPEGDDGTVNEAHTRFISLRHGSPNQAIPRQP